MQKKNYNKYNVLLIYFLPNKNTLDNCKDTNSDITTTRDHIYVPVEKSFPLWITEMQIKQQTNYYDLGIMFVYFNKLIPCIPAS